MTAPAPKPAANHQETFVITREVPSTAANLTVKGFKAHRAGIVDYVRYVNATGLATDTTNVFAGVAKKGATQFAAIFDTDSDNTPSAALVANTWVTATLDTDSSKHAFAADDEIDFVATKGGTQTLPAGTVQFIGRYL